MSTVSQDCQKVFAKKKQAQGLQNEGKAKQDRICEKQTSR